ncbi:ABC transporter permease [Pseudonocardia humida]|uniref:ABC transporter permease n=1 Tax=Pseudonocardia humida TaxID=2800819 RepID=UPI00207CC6C7|nr:hypothetical protein [Pseudonocardia humida]
MTEALTGVSGLVRLIARRDRAVLGLWVLATVGLLAGAAASTASTYPSPQARADRYDQILAVPTFLVFQSRAFDDGVGALAAQQAFGGTTILAALGAALLVVRHTRGEEESGRRELLGSTVVGRQAPLAAILAVTLAAGVLIGVLGSAALISSGLPATGAVALGTVACGAAWIGAGMGAVAAQLTTRPALAAIGALGTFVVLHYLRGLVHLGGDRLAWLGWLIPNGWLEQVRPFADERWWPLALVAALTAALVAGAGALSARRDLGAALVAPRRGPATAVPALRDPLRLAWHLHRGSILAWSLGLAAIGSAMGAAGSAAVADYADLAWVADYASALRLSDPADAFFVYVVFVFVFVTAGHAVFLTLRLRTDEASGLAESLLATPTSRARWAAGHLGVALLAPVLLQTSLGVGLGVGAGAATGDLAGELTRGLGLALPLVPAVWVLVGVTVAAFGAVSRTAPVLGWLAIGIGIGAEIAVKAGVLPEAVYRAVSPFSHVSAYYRPTPLVYIGLVIIAGALIAAGIALLQRRDVLPE